MDPQTVINALVRF